MAVAPIAVLFVVALLLLTVPGVAVLRAAQFRSAAPLDQLVAAVGLSVAACAAVVLLLLFAGLYVWLTIVGLLAGSAAYLVRSFRRGHSRLAPTAAAFKAYGRGLSRTTLLVVTVLGSYLTILLVDALTTPIAWWDGLATWDKWATNWARRTNAGGIVLGGYPQLLPMFSSLIYKLTGNADRVLPADMFALHGVHVVFAGWFVAAAVRLAAVVGVRAWPVLAAAFGLATFRAEIGWGTADLLVAAFLTTTAAMYIGYVRGVWTAARPRLILALLIFGCGFTKITGLIVIGILVSVRALSGGRRIGPTVAKETTLAILASVILLGAFYAQQLYTDLRVPVSVLNAQETNLRLREMPGVLRSATAIAFRDDNGLVSRVSRAWRRTLIDYGIPGWFRPFFTGAVLLLVLGAMTTRDAVALLLPVVFYVGGWLCLSSYDLRNVTPVVPLIAAGGALGVPRLRSAVPIVDILLRSALGAVFGIWILAATLALSRDTIDLIRGLRHVPARVAALPAGPERRVETFFPPFAPQFRFLRDASELTGAAHVYLSLPFYRFFSNGIYVPGYWSASIVRPGDLFGGHDEHAPPGQERWWPIGEAPLHFWRGTLRIWVLPPDARPFDTVTRAEGSEGVSIAVGGDLRCDGFLYGHAVARGDLIRNRLLVWSARLAGQTDAATPEHRMSPDAARLVSYSSTAAVREAPDRRVLGGALLFVPGAVPAPGSVFVGVRAPTASPCGRLLQFSLMLR